MVLALKPESLLTSLIFFHMHFRFAPRSMTFDDLELLQVQIFSEFCATSHFLEATKAVALARLRVYRYRRNYCFRQPGSDSCLYEIGLFYKLCSLMYRVKHNTAPSYLSELCVPCSDTRLRSTTRGNYIIPRTHRHLANRSPLQHHLLGTLCQTLFVTPKVIAIFLSKL